MISRLRFNAFQHNKKLSLLFLSIFLLFTIIALLIGISDNPPGILFLYLGTASLILSFIHNWNKSVTFVIFLATVVVTFFVSVLLHNVLDVVAEQYLEIEVLKYFVKSFAVIFFLVAVIGCPPAAIISIVGIIKCSVSK